jgi:hypothetical protein
LNWGLEVTDSCEIPRYNDKDLVQNPGGLNTDNVRSTMQANNRKKVFGRRIPGNFGRTIYKAVNVQERYISQFVDAEIA